MLPLLGKLVAKDEASYRYLAESIRMHPNQETLLGMMKDAGLEGCRYHNLTGGIVARPSRATGTSEPGMLTSTIENVLEPRPAALAARAPALPGAARAPRRRRRERPDSHARGIARAKRCALTRDAAAAAEAEIAGGPLSLLALAGDAPEAVLQRGDVQIRGDAELAQKFRELAMLLRPDLEEELSKVIGDVPAHQHRPLRACGVRLDAATPPPPQCATSRNILRTSASIWCRAPKAINS